MILEKNKNADVQSRKLPAETLTMFRKELNPSITLECDERVKLFPYDKNTFILQSFFDKPKIVRVHINKSGATLVPLAKTFPHPERVCSKGNKSTFNVQLMPGSYSVFKIE